MIYQLRGQNIPAVQENSEINKILNHCKTLHENISRLRQKHHGIDENRLNSQVSLLSQVLETQNINLIRLTISKKSPMKGCKVKDLKLPPDVLILCVIKKNRLMIANGDTQIDDQDHVFVVGPEDQIDRLNEGTHPNPQ